MKTSARLAVGALLVVASRGAAQTDYYNTDAGRPVRVEDAFPVEHHAFELQIAPLRVERGSGGRYRWEVEPELAWGVLPRTQVELSLPLRYEDSGGAVALAGITLAALHNLNNETSLPALAVAARVALPVGGSAPEHATATVGGLATRTLRFARFHANGEVTLGPSSGDDSRWMAGLAIDRALPLRSLLITADLFAEQPMDSEASPRWTAEAGLRVQTSPQLSLDAGVGRTFAGAGRGWFATVGAARAFSIRALAGRR